LGFRNVAYALVFVLELECVTLNAFLYLNLVNVFQAWLTLAYLTLAYITLPLLQSMLRPYQFGPMFTSTCFSRQTVFSLIEPNCVISSVLLSTHSYQMTLWRDWCVKIVHK